MKYYVIKYTGPFGFIKPWTAVRDSETFSQQFLTPSIIEGIRQKLGVKEIFRHRLTYAGVDMQQEQTQPRGWEYKKNQKMMIRERSILKRGILIDPVLYLAFGSKEEAEKAATQHICLCRNEDILFPDDKEQEMEEHVFNALPGFELKFGRSERSFLVGFNRFNGNEPMYGELIISSERVKE